MQRYRPLFILLAPFILLIVITTALVGANGEWATFLPIIRQPEPLVEMRGLWVSRFDWTLFNAPANPSKLDEIVANADLAGFNTIFFQVRGSADAYYTPGLEPWAQRVSGDELGTPPDPLWDPLVYLITQAHARGIQVHAYLNIHPVWDKCDEPPPMTSPTPLYYILDTAHGNTEGLLNGVQWGDDDTLHCSIYQRSSPASDVANDHIIAVATDIVTRYGVDGLHLDNIRYGGATTSCDPVSEALFGADCFSTAGYGDWQREQVDQLVARFYNEVVPLKENLWLSAAVWPVYQDYWGWQVGTGYGDYYQDSKQWVADGIIDSISPMIYPGAYNCPDDSFWTQSRWELLVSDFQTDSAGRYVIPGIGTGYCDFAEIANRIEHTREAGMAGHALFAYAQLLSNDYFDDLANGPYAIPAVVPPIPWHN